MDTARCPVRVLLLAACLFSFFLAGPATVQAAGGTINGEITDDSGAVIPQAEIVITNLGTELMRTLHANERGYYSAPNLLPGRYSVAVSASGFSTVVRSDLNVEVGGEMVVNVQLRLGGVRQKVDISSESPAVDLAGSSLSASVNGTSVRELPFNGRSWTDLAILQRVLLQLRHRSPITRAHREEIAALVHKYRSLEPVRNRTTTGSMVSVSTTTPTVDRVAS